MRDQQKPWGQDVTIKHPYQNFGPFYLPRTQDGLAIDKDKLKGFWADVESKSDGLSAAVGCYVFAIRAGRGLRPWYVGKANGRQAFHGQVCNPRNLLNYGGVLRRYESGTPIVFLIARKTRTGRKFARNVQDREIRWVEKYLIAFAAEANNELVNKQEVQMLRECRIPGLLNGTQGQPDSPTRHLRRLFNISPVQVGLPEVPVDLDPDEVEDNAPSLPELDTGPTLERLPDLIAVEPSKRRRWWKWS